MTEPQESPQESDVVERARQALDGIETPTPWVAKWGGVYGTSGPKNTYRGTDGSPSVATAEGGFVEGEFLEGDADFIAAAPGLVRDLLAEVERLRDDLRVEGLIHHQCESVDDEVERLRTDLARMTERAEGAEVAWQDAKAERDALRAAIDRVRALADEWKSEPYRLSPGEQADEATCVLYECGTRLRRALDGEVDQ